MSLRPHSQTAKQPRLSADDRRMVARINRTRSVMRYFGMTPQGYDPGVVGRLGNGAHIELSTAALNWIQPLLEELRERRKEDTK